MVNRYRVDKNHDGGLWGKSKKEANLDSKRLPSLINSERSDRKQTPYSFENNIGTFEVFDPQPGVTYYEKGKNKTNPKSFNEAIGKITKAEYTQKHGIGYKTLANLVLPLIIKEADTQVKLGDLTFPAIKEEQQIANLNAQELEYSTQELLPQTTKVNKAKHFDLSSLVVRVQRENYGQYYSKSPLTIAKSQMSVSKDETKNDIDKFNIEIVGNLNWGNNSISNPLSSERKFEKPSSRDFRLSFGESTKLPRERLAGIRHIQKERLAPPLLGYTIGHGFKFNAQ